MCIRDRTEVWPHVLNQMLFQLINVTYAFLIHPVLKTAPNSVVSRVQVRAVRWPEVGRDELWCDLAKIFDTGTCTMGWCAVLLENKQVAGNLKD